jgi:hypothetical protein
MRNREEIHNPTIGRQRTEMKKPLRHDTTQLEERVQQLIQAMMQDGKTRAERNRLESELRVAQQVLEDYQQTAKI